MPRLVKLLAAILVLGLFMGLVRLYTTPPALEGDQTNTWWPASMHVANGDGFVDCLPIYFPFCGPENEATAMREPIPVYLFAGVILLHGSLWTAGLVQLFLQLLIIILVFKLGNELAGEEVGLITAALWVLYLPALVVMPQIAGDLVATLAMTAGLYWYAKAWRNRSIWKWALSGACLAVAVLSRSALMVAALPLGMAAFLHSGRMVGSRIERLVPVLAFGSAWGLVMLPWVVRNTIVFDQVVVGSTLTGYNILRHNHQLQDQVPFHYVNEEEARPVAMAALARHPELSGRENEAQVDRIYKKEGMAVLHAHPARYLAICTYRFLPLWFNWGVNRAYGKPIGALDYLIALEQAALLVLALLGLRSAPRRTWPLALAAVFVFVAYLAVVARLRYVIPMMPIVLLFAAIAINGIGGAWARNPFRASAR
jgi:4-amino-4-deoxy-L-arabinose transferase-like glycosyltransferase